MSVPVPLGVRIYDHQNNVDMWVTKWIDDLQYRSVIPGGFASASFRLHVPQYMYPVSAAWSARAPRIPLVTLFNRVQVVDLRSGEIAWEGRIDSAARVADDGFAWDIGCAGAMVSATDITKPVFYADSSTDWWFSQESLPSRADVFTWSRSSSPPSLSAELKNETQWDDGGTLEPGGVWVTYFHFLCLATAQYIGRFTVTYRSDTPSSGTIKTRTNVYTPATDTWQEGVDSTNLGSSEITKANPVGAVNSFTSTQAQVINFDILGPSTSVILSRACPVTYANPIIIAMRMDRNGNNLTSSANYSTDYVTVSQVVEDVLGRFLNNGWSVSGPSIPANASVGAAGAYIDTSDGTPITDLRFTDGATAADILNKLMTVQTNAYWAIWESQNTATSSANSQRYRFEWTTWPNGWGYQASSTDGLDEQPDAGNMYNYVFYRYQGRNFQGTAAGSYVPPPDMQEWWDFEDPRTAPLLNDRLTRAATVVKEGPVTDAAALASEWIAENGQEVNAGTLTVKRPIQFYDAGATSTSASATTEDFEDATLNITVTNAGNAAWARSTASAHTGSWSLKSGTITDGQTSDAIIAVPAGATQVQFWYRVSSENTFDFFRFFIDGVQQFQASGPGSWTQSAVYDVTGASTITCRYVKDATQAAGEDAAYIDDLTFTGTSLNSGNGAGRMVDPWAIRPGKLLRITDIPTQADSTSIAHGTAAPPATHAGAVFRVVSTDYDAADNSCRLGLDQVDIWSLAGQILPSAPTNARTAIG